MKKILLLIFCISAFAFGAEAQIVGCGLDDVTDGCASVEGNGVVGTDNGAGNTSFTDIFVSGYGCDGAVSGFVYGAPTFDPTSGGSAQTNNSPLDVFNSCNVSSTGIELFNQNTGDVDFPYVCSDVVSFGQSPNTEIDILDGSFDGVPVVQPGFDMTLDLCPGVEYILYNDYAVEDNSNGDMMAQTTTFGDLSQIYTIGTYTPPGVLDPIDAASNLSSDGAVVSGDPCGATGMAAVTLNWENICDESGVIGDGQIAYGGDYELLVNGAIVAGGGGDPATLSVADSDPCLAGLTGVVNLPITCASDGSDIIITLNIVRMADGSTATVSYTIPTTDFDCSACATVACDIGADVGNDVVYCFGDAPADLATDAGSDFAGFDAGPNATPNAGVAYVEICGDYDSALDATPGDPTSNPAYTGFIVPTGYTYATGTATGTDGEGTGCDYITLVPVTYIDFDPVLGYELDADVANICVGTPIRLDFRPEITVPAATYDCTLDAVTLTFSGGSPDDGTQGVNADGTATVTGEYTVSGMGTNPANTISGTTTGGSLTLTGLAEDTYTYMVTDPSGCSEMGTLTVPACTVCPAVTTPAGGTQDLCAGAAPDFLDATTGFVGEAPTGTTTAMLMWYTDQTADPAVAPATPYIDAATSLNAPADACFPEPTTLYAYYVCDLDGDAGTTDDISYIDAGSITVTVYPAYDASTITVTPDPATPASDCTEPAVTSSCANYVITADAGNPATPPGPGDAAVTYNYTITYNAPVDASCFSEPFMVTVNCPAAGCPSPTATDDSDAICTDAGLGTEVADWQTALATANMAAIDDGNTAAVEYSSMMVPSEVATPDGIVADGISSDACASQTQTTYAYLLCYGDDGVLGGDDDSYLLLGTHTLTIYPEIQAPTITPDAVAPCIFTVTGACTGDLVTLSGQSVAAGMITGNGTNAVTYTAAAGDAAGTVNIDVASSIVGSTCMFTQSNTATPACPADPVCMITSLGLSPGACMDANPATESTADDTFVLTIDPTGSTLGATYDYSINTTPATTGTAIAYGAATTVTLPADGTALMVTVTDVSGGTCTLTESVTAPASCSPAPAVCAISVTISNFACDDGGTPEDPSDDMVTFDYEVEDIGGTGTTWSSDQGDAGAAYSTAGSNVIPVGPIPATNMAWTINVTEDDAVANPNCTATASINLRSCETVENIPTVGEWGLIILGLMMSITAIVGIRQRREEEAVA